MVCQSFGNERNRSRYHASCGWHRFDRHRNLPHVLHRLPERWPPFVAGFLAHQKDATDAIGTLLYYLGRRQEKPEFRRFNYAEKAEYWALVWGLFVMAGTGIMLWAKVFVGDILARWWLDVATAIHFYEAVLATLAIVVWHFYQVFFDPDVYPMNWAWWDGKMSYEHYREEHGLDSETLLAAARSEIAAEPDSSMQVTDPVAAQSSNGQPDDEVVGTHK